MAKRKNVDLHDMYLAEFNRLAKKADRRLRELERWSRQKEFKDIKKYAYRIAKQDIMKHTPKGQKRKAPRFQRNVPSDINTQSLIGRINEIEKFLALPTSTISGVKKVYKKRADSLNKRIKRETGSNPHFTWEDMANFFDTGLMDKTKDDYGSATVLAVLGVMKSNSQKIAEQIKSKNEAHLQLSDDIVINQRINDMLTDYGADVAKLIRKKVI